MTTRTLAYKHYIFMFQFTNKESFVELKNTKYELLQKIELQEGSLEEIAQVHDGDLRNFYIETIQKYESDKFKKH